MERCQICNRYPAKWVNFKAHVGYVVVRSEVEYSGTLCRDHALEAYFAARGKTAKGMWFSAGSLLFGVFRSLWDSAKLLDLPEEVKDEPWVPHVVGCPHCSAKHWAPAGPITCTGCGKPFVIGSCEHCRTVHVGTVEAPISATIPKCRNCERATDRLQTVRNWPLLLAGVAVAEAAAAVAQADGTVSARERAAFRHAVKTVFDADDAVCEWLDARFQEKAAAPSFEQLELAVKNCEPAFVGLIVTCAGFVAEADGPITVAERLMLDEIIRRCGLDPETVFGDGASARDGDETTAKAEAPSDATSWWVVLGVKVDAELEQIDAAYRRLAMQFHPDRWEQIGTEAQRRHAGQRMKEINAAYAAARVARPAPATGSPKRTSGRRQSSRTDAPRKKPRHEAPRREPPRQDVPPARPATTEYAAASQAFDNVASAGAEQRKEWDNFKATPTEPAKKSTTPTDSDFKAAAEAFAHAAEDAAAHVAEDAAAQRESPVVFLDEFGHSWKDIVYPREQPESPVVFLDESGHPHIVAPAARQHEGRENPDAPPNDRAPEPTAESFDASIASAAAATPVASHSYWPAIAITLCAVLVLSGMITLAVIADQNARASKAVAATSQPTDPLPSEPEVPAVPKSGGPPRQKRKPPSPTPLIPKTNPPAHKSYKLPTRTTPTPTPIAPPKLTPNPPPQPLRRYVPAPYEPAIPPPPLPGNRPPRRESADAAFRRGLKLEQANDLEGAVEAYTRAVATGGRYANTYNNRGYALCRLGKLDQAMADLNEAIRLDPKHASAWSNRALVWLKKGKYSTALDDAEKSIRFNPGNAYAHLNMARAYLSLGKKSEADRYWQAAKRLAPEIKDSDLRTY